LGELYKAAAKTQQEQAEHYFLNLQKQAVVCKYGILDPDNKLKEYYSDNKLKVGYG
jgi:hypothetical protein